jgi:hypothetical protein
MSRSADRLYALLPAVHRARDEEAGGLLRALIGVIGEQVDVVEKDIDRLCDNWFIETCDDWVVPYIADLIGYRPVLEAGLPATTDSVEGRLRNKRLIPRQDVADTVGHRRQKGTLSLFEKLAASVTDWPARAVEFYRLLGWTQNLDHLHLDRGRTVDLRDGEALERLGGPFDRLAHTVDVRRTISSRQIGRYNIPSIGVFVWRLKPYSVKECQPLCIESEGPECFTFSVLGNDTQLYTKPEPALGSSNELALPLPISRSALTKWVENPPPKTKASDDYYGEGRSFAIYAKDWPTPGQNPDQPIPSDRIIPADLSDWRYSAPRDHVLVDPVLGRIAFPVRQRPAPGLRVTYRYGFSADMGGGEYDRTLSQPQGIDPKGLYYVDQGEKEDLENRIFNSIGNAIAAWDKAKPRAAVIEIKDSRVYTERLSIALEAEQSLQIRAANRRRPVIRILDQITDGPDTLAISGKRASRFVIDGLVIVGRNISIRLPADPDYKADDDLCDVIIRHSTLVPGWALECNCDPKRPNEPSIEILDSTAKLRIEHSIVGSIYVVADEKTRDPVDIAISDSIIDATDTELVAIGTLKADMERLAFANLTIVRTTVIGKVGVHAVPLAENTIFMSQVQVARRQIGCMRFCYVTPVSRTPRRYHCQPDISLAQQKASVRPRFNSLRYGHATYCQLALDCAAEISRGADDESEMGAFHDLFQPHRTANLRARLDEYAPAAFDAGILFAN